MQHKYKHSIAYACSLQDAAVSTFPANLKRGLDLISQSQWLQAMDFFKAAASFSLAMSTGSSGAAAITQACISLCAAKLDLQPSSLISMLTASSAPSDQSAEDSHPLYHLASALWCSQGHTPPGSKPSSQAPPISPYSQRFNDGRIVSHSLCCLLHPATPLDLLRDLQLLAFKLFEAHTVSFSSPAAAALAAKQPAQGVSEPPAWREHAANFPAFQKLLDLTGLFSVKTEMGSLIAQVRYACCCEIYLGLDLRIALR